jgi:hypothetical protein
MIDIVQDVLQSLTASQQDQAAIRQTIGQLIELTAKPRAEYPLSFDAKAIQGELSSTLDVVLQKITVDSFINVTQDLLSRAQPSVSPACGRARLATVSLTVWFVYSQLIARALDLVVERVPLIRSDLRISLSDAMVQILQAAYAILGRSEATLQTLAIKAISAITRIVVHTEDAIVAQAIGSLTKIAQQAGSGTEILAAMDLLVDLT